MKFLAVLLIALATGVQAQSWKVQYFYDQDQSTLSIEDLAFPSAKRGVAVGTIYERSKDPRFTVLVTSDGGGRWSAEPIKEHPRSLFFLNDSQGWMVTDDGIWFSEESGRSWKKISPQRKADRKLQPRTTGGLILRLWFLDEKHGFASGLQKTFLETHDGGATWTPVEEAAKPGANPAFTAYTRIAFRNGKDGLAVGSARPPRPSDAQRLPPWMDPETAVRRREIPMLMILLQTRDGGMSWSFSTAPLFGSVSSLRMLGTDGLAVFGFEDSFDYPSEVYRLNLRTGASESVFRDKNRRVTDGALFEGPRAYLAAVDPPGKLGSSPIPGKVKILTSANLKDWTEMEVDYKAVARAVILAGPDEQNLWCATDTGMILHLTP